MAVAIYPPAVASCPPHFWLIEKVALHTYHWTCQRCGAEQEHHQDSPKLGHRWVDHRTRHH